MSRKKAIDKFFRSCIYDSRGAGTWRQQVEACTAYHCPLYEFRPVSHPKSTESEIPVTGTSLGSGAVSA